MKLRVLCLLGESQIRGKIILELEVREVGLTLIFKWTSDDHKTFHTDII